VVDVMPGRGEFLKREVALGQVSVRALRPSPADWRSAIRAICSFEAAAPRGPCSLLSYKYGTSE
jgi:hypothetical protein